MRALFFSLVLVLLAACGGNWSNSDLAFANALPRRDDLKSRLPTSSTAQPLTGVATRRDGLMVGDPSNAWAQTRKAATDYNGILDSLLALVDQVRQIAPTSRTATTRTWGPFDDANNAGRQVQVIMTRIDDANFEWRLDSMGGGATINILTGNFKATDTARRGQGTIVVHVKDFRDVVTVDANFKQLDEITMGYVTDVFPKRVEMLFTFKPGSTSGLSGLGYTSREQQDGSGAMRFVYTGPGPEVQELEINSAWKTTGEGKGVGVVRKGTYTGANVTECWGTSFAVAYYAESWAGGTTSGTASDCAVIEGL
jgi:hypothetical protein